MRKHLIMFIVMLALASCVGSRRVTQPELTIEQRIEIKQNGGFNPYYVSPEYQKVRMPKRPKKKRR